jgi:hypothetical protein
VTGALHRSAQARRDRRRAIARRCSWAMATVGATLLLSSLGVGFGLLLTETLTH